MRVIHISDLHLTDLSTVRPQKIRGKRRLGHFSWRGRRRYRHLPAHLEALRRAVLDAQPDFIVVTGDLVHIGLPSELAVAANWLAALAPPGKMLVTPGNHDLYAEDSWAACEGHLGDYLHLSPSSGEAGEAPFRRGFPSHVSLQLGAERHTADAKGTTDRPLGCLQAFHESVDGIELYGLNTGCPTPLGAASGRLGSGQRHRLERLMKQAPAGALKVVALHHAPMRGVMPGRKALIDADALEALLADAHLVLHGHGHWSRSYRCGAAQIFAVGSASTADAAFRQFDFHPQEGTVQVRMGLHVRAVDGDGFGLGEEAAFSVSTGR